MNAIEIPLGHLRRIFMDIPSRILLEMAMITYNENLFLKGRKKFLLNFSLKFFVRFNGNSSTFSSSIFHKILWEYLREFCFKLSIIPLGGLPKIPVVIPLDIPVEISLANPSGILL